jgi:hypothetical protein
MAGKRRSRRPPGHQRRGPAFVLAALFAVLLQAFVVQTHIHAPAAPIGIAVEQTSDAAHAEVSAPSDHQTVTCAVCQTLAGGGGLMLVADAPSFDAPHAVNEAAVFALPRAPPSASHAWQSRAPPILQA